MVPYKYSYIIGCLVFGFIWLLLYKNKPKYRLEMILLGVLGMLVGPVANYLFYLRDWWSPLYITGTTGGLEDFLLGFTNMGIVAVLYEELFNKKYTKQVLLNKLNYNKAFSRCLIFLSITLIPILIIFYGLGIHSFWANFVGLFFGGVFVLIKRPDLLKDSIYSSVLMPVISLPAFFIPELLSPGWISNYWMMEKLSGITFLYAPIEDLIWYALVGFCFGGLFEYLFDFRIKERK